LSGLPFFSWWVENFQDVEGNPAALRSSIIRKELSKRYHSVIANTTYVQMISFVRPLSASKVAMQIVDAIVQMNNATCNETNDDQL
jgi:hypothetical protein